MSQVEKPDMEDKTVVQEMRKGYLYKDKVLRPSLVAVSKKTETEN
jgi:molecular chaperone GrpE